jgi:3-oxoadipate enol-lactonase
MPLIERSGRPTLQYEIDDFTDEWKQAPVLILQHGFGRSSNFWYRWVPYLSRFFKVVRPNLRGLGQSPLDFDPETGYTAQALVDDVLAVLDRVSPGAPVHYCGESVAGIVGVMLAAEHPQRLRTLSLVAAPLTIPKETQQTFALGYSSWQEAMRTLGTQKWTDATNGTSRFPPDTDPQAQAWYAREMGKSNVESLVGLSRLAASLDARAQAQKITTPTLGLYPGNGRITRFGEEMVRKAIPGIRMVNLPTEFHAVQFLMAKQCAQHVLYFASQHDGTVCDE